MSQILSAKFEIQVLDRKYDGEDEGEYMDDKVNAFCAVGEEILELVSSSSCWSSISLHEYCFVVCNASCCCSCCRKKMVNFDNDIINEEDE